MKKFLIAMALLFIPISVFAEEFLPQTVTNLLKALKGKINASYRYELFAQKASKEGYVQIAKLFWAVSMAESVHSNNHKAAIFNIAERPDVVDLDSVTLGGTKQNLEATISSENIAAENIYPKYIKQADEDKIDIASKYFSYTLDSEIKHEKLFKDALANIGKNKEVDYCVSIITGDTTVVAKSEECPLEQDGKDKYIRIK